MSAALDAYLSELAQHLQASPAEAEEVLREVTYTLPYMLGNGLGYAVFLSLAGLPAGVELLRRTLRDFRPWRPAITG